jgi:hypothetical protein
MTTLTFQRPGVRVTAHPTYLASNKKVKVVIAHTQPSRKNMSIAASLT